MLAERASGAGPEVLLVGSLPARGVATPLRNGRGLGWTLVLAGLLVVFLPKPRG